MKPNNSRSSSESLGSGDKVLRWLRLDHPWICFSHAGEGPATAELLLTSCLQRQNISGRRPREDSLYAACRTAGDLWFSRSYFVLDRLSQVLLGVALVIVLRSKEQLRFPPIRTPLLLLLFGRCVRFAPAILRRASHRSESSSCLRPLGGLHTFRSITHVTWLVARGR